MNRATIHQQDPIKQDAKAGTMTKKGFSLSKLIESLILEHGKYHHASFTLDVDTLPIHDKRLILSHIEASEWLEYAHKSHIHTETLFSEHKNYIQKLIDEMAGEVYLDYQEEMRAYR